MKAINRTDAAPHLQLTLHFDLLPAFTTTTTGRRIDLELQDTLLADHLAPPPTDGKMIKMVNAQQKSKTVLSFYFRYPPQKVMAESNKESATLVLDIILGDPLVATSQELSSKLQGVATVKRADADALNPVTASAYAKNWVSFFTGYESPVEIAVPPRLLLPPFPLAAAMPPKLADELWLPAEIQALANENKWSQVYQRLRMQLENQPDESLKERLALAYGEALVRAGEYKEPHALLQKIVLQYPDTLMASLAQLLQIYQQAIKGDHISAYYELTGLFKKIENNIPFTAHCNLLLAELALMSGRTADAEKILVRDDVVRSEALRAVRLLRQADLLYQKKEKAKALTAYLELESQSPIIDTDPMSLAHFSDALYTDKRFPKAAKKYRLLGDLLNNKPGQDLALYRLAMAELHISATEKKARIDLQQIQDAFSRTEGGARALLKQIDLDFVAKRMNATSAETAYGKMATQADTVALREEAAFKQALVNALAGDRQKSVAQCMEILRSFQSGRLRLETKALLIEQLPVVIKQLVKDKEYVKALVLAKQNKSFFSNGWLNTNLLYDLANAYSNLGLADQTAQTYQYLFEISSEADKEKIYLPLLQGLFDADRYVQVEEYADRYLLNYPKGNDEPAIFLFKIRALYASGQFDQAVKLLQADTRHRTPQLELLKARIFFELKRWQEVIDTLSDPELQPIIAANQATLLLAEAYFQTGQDDLAAQAFGRMKEQGSDIEQAQFRLAQIESKKNNTTQALKLFKELAEKGKDPLWTKLAGEEAAILQLQQKK
ncbi:MAG: hypothetical protein JZU50_02255 [Desulfobulbaceae bacterium]|nr:hypothetical protein [Desulfobulbaceae bacterium]